MIKEADHQGGWVMYPTALPAFVEVNHNLHVAMKPKGIHVQESENKSLMVSTNVHTGSMNHTQLN